MKKTIQEITQENIGYLALSDRYGRIYNGKKEYMPSPKDVISEFNYDIKFAKLGAANIAKAGEGVEELENYSSYVLEASLHTDEIIEGYSGNVGILVNNSANKVTIFSGSCAAACTNLSIFGGEFVQEYNLVNSMPKLKSMITEVADKLVERLQHFKGIKDRMEKVIYTPELFINRKGELVSEMSIELFDYIKHAESLLRDKNSIYHSMLDTDWKLLQALTDNIKFRSPKARVDTTLQLEKYFLN